MTTELRIAYCAADLKGQGYELILDRVDGTMIGAFLNGKLWPSDSEVNSLTLKTMCATQGSVDTLVQAA